MHCPPAATARSSWHLPCGHGRLRTCIARTTLYDFLGVTSSASTAEIRAAYRRLAARYHPDTNSSLVAHEKFQALNLAAEVLTSELREQYDKHGTAALPGNSYKFLLDFLKQARAQGLSSVLGEPGGDLSTVLGLDFSEAVTGSAATVTLDVLGPCGGCKGSGFEATTHTHDCRVCKGSGEIMVRQWNPDGANNSSRNSPPSSGSSMLTLPRSCPACRGSGKSEQQECKRCEGEGRVQVRRRVRFKVPSGVVDGQVLRVKGQGHSGKYGGNPGDLLVRLQVYDLADVRRHGYDLHSVLELPLYEALLGGSVLVKTVRGHRHIMVPAGTQHGQLLCVQGAGVPRPGLNGVEYGHHYFEVSVRVPSAAAASQRELQLLQQLAAVQPFQSYRQQQARQAWPSPAQPQHSAGDVTQMQDQQHQSRAAGRVHMDSPQEREQQSQHPLQQAKHQAAGSSDAATFHQHSSDPPLAASG